MLDIPAGSMPQLYTSPGLGLFLDKARRGTLVGSFDPDRDSLFIVPDFAFVLRALCAVSTWVYMYKQAYICICGGIQGVKVKSERNGSIRISVKTASKSPKWVWVRDYIWETKQTAQQISSRSICQC